MESVNATHGKTVMRKSLDPTASAITSLVIVIMESFALGKTRASVFVVIANVTLIGMSMGILLANVKQAMKHVLFDMENISTSFVVDMENANVENVFVMNPRRVNIAEDTVRTVQHALANVKS